MSINSVNISGNLTRDLEVRYTKDGTPVASFGIAVNDRRKDPRTNEWKDVPNFIDCVIFGKRAESVAQYIGKGSHATVNGHLRYSSWERDGQRRSKIEVMVDDIDFSGNRQDRNSGGGYQQDDWSQNSYQQQSYEQQPSFEQQPNYEMPSSDIPF